MDQPLTPRSVSGVLSSQTDPSVVNLVPPMLSKLSAAWSKLALVKFELLRSV